MHNPFSLPPADSHQTETGQKTAEFIHFCLGMSFIVIMFNFIMFLQWIFLTDLIMYVSY